MGRLLYVEASPSKQTSHSIAVARSFLEAYRERHPADEIDVVDLWSITLPPFDAEMIAAKFAVLRRGDATEQQALLWEQARAWSRRFNGADKYLFALPMWNFGVPYPLKHFIDVVTLPEENWRWSRERGYEPLLSGKRAALVYSSAGDYPLQNPADPSDFQKPQMRRWLRFLGIDDVHEVVVGPTLAPPQQVAALRERAVAEARQLAARF